MRWWFFSGPFIVIQLLLPALMSIIWLTLRFGDRRRVPIAFYTFGLLSVVACFAAGLGLLISHRPSDDLVTDAGSGIVIAFWLGNGASGAAILGVLTLALLAPWSRVRGKLIYDGILPGSDDKLVTSSEENL